MRYYKFSNYLENRFGGKVQKVTVDAGFSCPNIDGKVGQGGCIYCDNKAFSPNVRRAGIGLHEQIRNGIAGAAKKSGAEKYIVYFQPFSNTYSDTATLKAKYDEIKKHKGIVGIAIGTRPDCITEDILDLIQDYSENYEVWIELGLQSVNAQTLKTLNRNHTLLDFESAASMIRRRKKIKLCAHVILGLPGETKNDMFETAKFAGRRCVDGIKIHPLHIIKGTKLEQIYRSGGYKPLEMGGYVSLATDFLEYLWPKTVIQRITADCHKDYLAAPEWLLEKHKVLEAIDSRMVGRDMFQGRLYGIA